MEERVERYLEDEKRVESPVVRKMLCGKVMRYEDIAEEFVKWLETREYDEGGVEIEGYTARKVFELAPQLDGVGVFNFLVTLRDRPEEAKKFIAEGFRVL